MRPIVIWGEVLWDHFPDGPRLGGAPANVAWHLGQLAAATGGSRPMLVSRVGSDPEGAEALRRLGQFVDTTLCQRDQQCATGRVDVAVDAEGEPRYRLVPDRAWEHIAFDAPTQAVVSQASVFAFGTLSQRTDAALAQWKRAISALAADCVRVCDPNLRPGRVDVDSVRAALAVADVIKVGVRELEQLASALGWGDPLAELRERARVVAVTDGVRGSTLYAESQVIKLAAAPAGDRGDAVGCGDAYLAALVWGLQAGHPLDVVGNTASRLSAAVASVSGATPVFNMEEILGS